MEESQKEVRGRGRPSSSSEETGGRRPGEYLADQPREKIRRANSSSNSSVDSRRRTPPEHDPGEGSSRAIEHHDRSEQQIKEEPQSKYQSNIKSSDKRDEAGDRQRGNTRLKERYEIIHTRPTSVNSKSGDAGREVKLQTNYFRLLKKPQWDIFQYRVDFEPDIELFRLKRGILSEQKSVLGGYLFDGTQLYVTRKLRDDKMILETKSRTGDIYKIIIKYVATVSMNEWQSLQILNLILRRAMEGLNLQLIGRNFFDAMAMINIQQYHIQLWPGYVTSIRQHEQDILVCAEITHKVMRTETVYEMMKNCMSESRRGGDHDWQQIFTNKILGKIVLTDYNNMTYRIDDVNFSYKAENTFNKKGKDISFIEYFYEKYKIRIRDPKQPMLVSISKEKQRRAGEDNIILLVPELCRPTGLTDDMRKNFQLMRELANTTKSDPGSRIRKLFQFNRRLQDTVASQQTLKDWNMKLDDNLVTVKGRTLPPEQILFAAKGRGQETQKVSAGDFADWTKPMSSGCCMFNKIKLEHWILIVPQRISRPARSFMDTIINAAAKLGMEIRRPTREIFINDDRSHSYDTALNQAANEDPQLILCVVPNDSVDRYNTIKKFCFTRRAIPSQVLQFRNVQKNSWPVAAKVAIQINAKLGGAPWMVHLPVSGLMVVGYDTCRGTNKSKSYGAMVATMDQKEKPEYFSSVVECNSNDNFANHLKLQLTAVLREYQTEHNSLPKRIIFYRDSVGDGALNQVFQHEVKELVEFLENAYKNNPHPLKFAFIIVSKQINTKFFENNRNPSPGTVVDNVVTLPERYDFYIVSQSVRQGCASPTSYNVLYDTSSLSPNQLQIATYKFCHLYYNWSGTTRVPAVCQYAKRLATLVATNLQSIPQSRILEKTLYFL